jgi:hypothetical protein
MDLYYSMFHLTNAFAPYFVEIEICQRTFCCKLLIMFSIFNKQSGITYPIVDSLTSE